MVGSIQNQTGRSSNFYEINKDKNDSMKVADSINISSSDDEDENNPTNLSSDRLKTDSNKSPVKCSTNYVPRVPIKRQRLKRRNERDERRFECEICGKIFVRISSLVAHRKNHLTMFPVHCQNCLRGFTYKIARNTHELNCHTVRWECFLCDHICKDKWNMQRHIRLKHTGHLNV